MNIKRIHRALISVFNKDGLLEIAAHLKQLDIEIVSTGGTLSFLKDNGYNAISVENLTGFPSIFGGRVKTLHPSIFGGILARRDILEDLDTSSQFNIPLIDLVVVDLYPFEEYFSSNASEDEIIEKIDIGGISLIRAAAKNFNDVVVIPSKDNYSTLLEILKDGANTSLEQRKTLAAVAFKKSSTYDNEIFNFMSGGRASKTLRYGENPHQSANFKLPTSLFPAKLSGKELSYNNLLDIEAAVELISEFDENVVAIIKHNNACGCAADKSLLEAWKKALSSDPTSAFGGVIVTNSSLDDLTALEINNLFFEIIIAPDYSPEAYKILSSKENRIILKGIERDRSTKKVRSLLGGLLTQEQDLKSETEEEFNYVTYSIPTSAQKRDLVFANKIVKHLKSNAIAIVKDSQLIGAGMGQTSRIDALQQAITKAKHFGFDLKNASLASDAFFPFSDSVESAYKEGIDSIIQPGGSKRDKDSIDYCNMNKISMVFTGNRHFKH